MNKDSKINIIKMFAESKLQDLQTENQVISLEALAEDPYFRTAYMIHNERKAIWKEVINLINAINEEVSQA